MRKLNFFGSMCLRSLHVTVLFFWTLPLGPCTPFPLSYCCRKTPNFLKTMNFFRYNFFLFNVGSLDHQRCRCRSRPAFPFATVPIISFILKADSAFSTTIFTFHFRPVITEGWAFFTCGSESHVPSGKVALFLIITPQQVTTLEDLVSLMNYIVSRLLKS